MRAGRTRKLKVVDRDKTARAIRAGRAQDRAVSYFELIKRNGRIPSKWRSTAGLQEYNSLLGLSRIHGRKSIERIIADKFAELQKNKVGKVVEFLDAGCALGQTIAELGNNPLTKGKINSTGLTLARPIDEKQLKKHYLELRQKLIEARQRGKLEKLDFNYEKAVEELKLWKRNRAQAKRIHVGLAENIRFGKTFDLIVSTGMLEVAPNPIQAVENLVNHLRVNGTAILQLGLVLPEEKMIALSRDGFRVECFGKNVYRIDRTSRKTAKIS